MVKILLAMGANPFVVKNLEKKKIDLLVIKAKQIWEKVIPS